MIYIEGLPSFTTHTILAQLFSRFGSVLHISMPSYPKKKNLKVINKGFAFVELDVIFF